MDVIKSGNNSKKNTMKEYCFDSGHHDDLEQVCNIDLSFVNCLNTTSPVMLAAKNIFSDKVNNPLRTALDIDSTLRCLYISICSVYELHAMHMQRDLVLPEDNKELFFKKEEIIHILNRIVNTAIMNFCIIFDNTFRGKIKFDCIGSIENNKKVSAELKERIKEHINWVEFKPLFKTINDLNNALKHHILYEESASYYCKETPIYRVLLVPGNDLSKTCLLNYSFRHIIAGFNDFLLFWICNKKNETKQKIIEYEILK